MPFGMITHGGRACCSPSPLARVRLIQRDSKCQGARLCTQWVRAVLGRKQSGIADLNTKGAILWVIFFFFENAQGFGHGLILK